MRPTFRLILFLLVLIPTSVRATPSDAERVQASFQSDMKNWVGDLQGATTAEARARIAEKRPDPKVYCTRMWRIIAPALTEQWALEPMAWFVGMAINLRETTSEPASNAPSSPADTRPITSTTGLVFSKELQAIEAAIGARHMKTQKLAPVCLAYAAGSDPGSLKLLEKIQASHADKPVQGVAALAIAIRLRGLGDAPELMSRRLSLLRKAIIDSADLEIQGTPVTKLIQNELYVVTHLTKGRVAPDLNGVDSGGRPLRLSNHRGKVTVLLFWNSGVNEVVRLLESMGALHKKHEGKIVIVGVNGDTVENLRTIQKTDTDLLEFPNFSDPRGELAASYRVTGHPLAFVLDAEGRIQYSGMPGSFMEATIAGLLEAPAPPRSK